ATQLRNAFLWLWGGLSGASWDTVLVACVYFPLPVLVLLAAARPLDVLALGEEPARHLGADVEPLKRRVYLAASLLTAAAVAVSGVIGFVGLIVPHAMRLLWGHRHRSLLPASFLAGGTLLALADTAARVAVAPRARGGTVSSRSASATPSCAAVTRTCRSGGRSVPRTGRRSSGRWSGATPAGWQTAGCGRCRRASTSACAWRARSPRSRGCSCSTSRPRVSTCATRWSCSSWRAGSRTGGASPS